MRTMKFALPGLRKPFAVVMRFGQARWRRSRETLSPRGFVPLFAKTRTRLATQEALLAVLERFGGSFTPSRPLAFCRDLAASAIF
jgi:hypothetical protein